MKADEDRGRENCERIVENNQFAACLNSFGREVRFANFASQALRCWRMSTVFFAFKTRVFFSLVRQVANQAEPKSSLRGGSVDPLS